MWRRKPNRHIAFGQADHACAGMNVARLEARIAIGRMLDALSADWTWPASRNAIDASGSADSGIYRYAWTNPPRRIG